ncbi:hypothetical protein [Actinacidiphila bryophytorum]|uniref:hypothetical protein n=1 Tax=Actinacidiphila bryophytorum TaxID=1436133 RepID=UPI001961BFDA|nr:hypothetical protein [Actinacidiphila bryophytorum]MBM9437221.1 hypothetical protein [Actinacidiphila bryophytorum]MBN6541741.1 hypothetical protein [Actinacidiphila bryophytorum]
MAGLIVVFAEAPPFGRAGKLGVVIDGHKVGPVRQGETAEFAVESGPHTVRVAGGGSRSNTVDVTVTDGGTCKIASSGTGLGAVATMVPLLGLVLGAFPGLVFRLRIHDPRPAPAPVHRVSDGDAGGSTGLWWESDPVLAKRYRKDAG